MDARELAKLRTCRQRFVSISPELILAMLTLPESGVVIDGRERVKPQIDIIPPSAKAVRCAIDDMGYVNIVIEDESFDEVCEGHRMPQMTPRYSTELL